MRMPPFFASAVQLAPQLDDLVARLPDVAADAGAGLDDRLVHLRAHALAQDATLCVRPSSRSWLTYDRSSRVSAWTIWNSSSTPERELPVEQPGDVGHETPLPFHFPRARSTIQLHRYDVEVALAEVLSMCMSGAGLVKSIA
jgi:hypothetical protein